MKTKREDVAKSYILYRNKRNVAREAQSDLIKKVYTRVNASAVENSNANVDENSFSGREKEASSDIQKYMALELASGLSKEVSDAHKNMIVYQHDLEKALLGIHNCLNVDIPKQFKNGFATRNGDVRAPGTLSTGLQQIAVVLQCQSQVQFGGVGIIHLDYDLAPYVKKSFRKYYKTHLLRFFPKSKLMDKIHSECSVEEYPKHFIYKKIYKYAMEDLEKEGLQSCEALYHNLNTLESRQGSQVPFTSINLGRDTSFEGKKVTEWILKASLSGIGRHHLTSIFPISIFQYKQGVNSDPSDSNYELKQLALKSMSKRIYPNWVNGDWSQANENPHDPDTYMSSMGCRTLVGYDRHGCDYKRQGRGNNVPNTIILPKLGLDYGIALGERKTADLDGFWNEFEKTLLLAEKGLLERFAIMIKQSAKSAPFMYKNGTIVDSDKCEESVYNALKHNTLAIGYLGIAEMCYGLFGATHSQSKEAYDFALSVVKRINTFAAEASERNDLNFSCYATPAEGLCSTALKAIRKQYGVIEGVTDKDYFTNSHHVPVKEKISIYDKLNLEAPFCKYPTGGCITYVELESTFVNNLKAVEDIIDYAFKELDIPYLAFNFPIDTCLSCGFQGEMNDICPECGGSDVQHLRRVTGYLTSDYRNFNEGKIAEERDRVKHSKYTILGE